MPWGSFSVKLHEILYLRLTDIIGREGEEMGLGLVAWI